MSITNQQNVASLVMRPDSMEISQVVPSDVLWQILDRLPVTADRIRFASVCVSWRTAAAENRSKPAPQVPWLMLPSPTSFYSLSEKREYCFDLPEICGHRIVGSSEGCIVWVDNYAELHMFNPITISSIDLPPIASLPDLEATSTGNYVYRLPPPYPPVTFTKEKMCNRFFTKVVLSPDSTPGSYLAVGIYRTPDRLAVARADNKSWVTVKMPFVGIEDIIFHKGMLYALSSIGMIIACDLTDPYSPKFHSVAQGVMPPPMIPLKRIYKYLVAMSGGELLQVWRVVGCNGTEVCSVMRVDVGIKEWVEVDGIGDHSLFLSRNCSVAICTKDFYGVRGNCVYFSDDSGVEIYNLEDDNIETLWWQGEETEKKRALPVWFTPALM